MIATLLMTVWMLAENSLVPAHKTKPLPPETITKSLETKTGIKPALTDNQHKGLSLLNHLLYGSVIAIPLSFISPHSKMRRLGANYGLGVWLSNYLGILPSLNDRGSLWVA